MKLEDLLKPEYEVHIIHNKKESYTKASGTLPSLLTALSMLVKALKKNGATDNMINYAVKQGLMSNEQLDKEIKENLDELIKKMFD